MEGIAVILTPLIAFVLIGLFGRRLGDIGSGVLTSFAGFLTFVFSLITAKRAIEEPFHVKLYKFIELGDYTLEVGFYFDALSSTTAVVVSAVASLIFVYSIGYMRHHFGRWVYKFYAYMNLFLFSMLLIVLSDNLLGMFFGWEGVGLASYLLIGYYHEQRKATNSALEAFVMNRVGDWLFVFGIIVLFIEFGTLEVVKIFEGLRGAREEVVSLGALLLFGGAVGKSGQVPLHTWLPNAMAGPTPVSALLHAATMVAAGVYMVARLYPVFESVPEVLKVVVLVGSVTAMMAALAASVQRDIKKIVAFSTMSQLGYMYMGLGVGDREGAMFHLTTHAFFKALLFLSVGAVISAYHHKRYDIYEFGGLREGMPVSHWSFVVGALALSGIFPFSGFWSKDRLIGSYFEWGVLLGVLGVLVAFVTGYYIFRECFVVFYGRRRGEAKEVGGEMVVPMVVLGVMSVVVGFLGGWYVSVLGGEGKGMHMWVGVVSVGSGLFGILVAYMVYVRGVVDVGRVYEGLRVVHETFKEQFFTEKLYHKFIARGYLDSSKVLYISGERQLIDGIVNGLARIVSSVGESFRFLQGGKLNWYVVSLSLGLSVLVFLILMVSGGL